MIAAQFSRYGGPGVLEVSEAPEPHADSGQVRIAVRAASINPIDWKIRAGYMAEVAPVAFPAIGGFDAAGVVDEVGADVEGVAIGDEVFGLGQSTHAQFAVLRAFVPKPASIDWPVAGALGVAGETSVRVLNLLGVGSDSTVLIDGAAGGVGAVAVQVATARGARVIGTASERNHAYLRDLAATPIVYGDGLVDRVRAVAPDGVDAVVDVVGQTPIPDLVQLVTDPQQVVSIANFGAAKFGARFTSGGSEARGALTEIAGLVNEGRLKVEVQTFPLAEAGEAQRLSQEGHVRGKLVLVI